MQVDHISVQHTDSISFSLLQLGKDYPVTVTTKEGLKVTDPQ